MNFKKTTRYFWPIFMGLIITFAFQNCGQFASQHFQKSSSNTKQIGKEAPALDAELSFNCTDPNTMSVTPLKRLSNTQITETYHYLLKERMADPSSVISQLPFNLIPTDEDEFYDRLDNTVQSPHANAYFSLAQAFGEAVTQQNSIEEFTGCKSSINLDGSIPSCASNFIREFGASVLRRPLDSSEQNTYESIFTHPDLVSDGNLNDALYVFIGRILNHPEFVYHMYYSGTPINGNQVQLSAFEVASRLSFHFWNTPPSKELIDLVKNTDLSSPDDLDSLSEFFRNSDKTKSVLKDFYHQWLKFDHIPQISFEASQMTEIVGDYANVNHDYRTDMVNEVEDMLDHYLFNTQGTLKDLLLSDISFTESEELSKLYGVNPRAGSNDLSIRLPSTERSGILTRAAFVMSGYYKTAPIDKGVHIRRNVLCDNLASPDFGALPDDFRNESPSSEFLTTKERVATMTSGSACIGCHISINGLGFPFEAYDPLGKFRTAELLFDEDGTFQESKAVDPSSIPMILPGDQTPSSGPVQLMELISNSGKADMCFAQNYFRYSYTRYEDRNKASCSLDKIDRFQRGQGGSLMEMALSIIYDNQFYRIKHEE